MPHSYSIQSYLKSCSRVPQTLPYILFSSCCVLIQLLFSQTLNNNWTTTEQQADNNER